MRIRLKMLGVVAAVVVAAIAVAVLSNPIHARVRFRARAPVQAPQANQAPAPNQIQAPIQPQVPVQAQAPVHAVQAPAPVHAEVKVDPELREYKATQAFKLKIIGSDTMKNEMAALMEGFTKFYPNVGSEIEGKGSASAPPALIAGTAQFAPMSRGMNAREVDEFKKKFGYPPVALPTSIDMLEVYVHKDNPIQGMTMQQVDAVFSRTQGWVRQGHQHLGRPGFAR